MKNSRLEKSQRNSFSATEISENYIFYKLQTVHSQKCSFSHIYGLNFFLKNQISKIKYLYKSYNIIALQNGSGKHMKVRVNALKSQ